MKRHYKTHGEISFLLEEDDHGESYVECTYALRYQVTPFREECGLVLDVEILDVSLESAVAWIGDAGANVTAWDRPFEVNAVSKFNTWHDYWLMNKGVKWYPHQEQIEALVLEDYETRHQIAAELWSE